MGTLFILILEDLSYFVYCSPLIVGAVTIVTDTPTDQICVMLLSTWMRADTPREKHLQYLDRKKFKEGTLGKLILDSSLNSKDAYSDCISEFNTTKLFKELNVENDPNLLSIFTRIRQISVLPLWMRSTFVLRGIPVWNANSG